MAIPPHTLNLYQKPAVGSGYLDRFTVHNYRHRISSVGWFDTATCDIVPRSIAAPQQFIDQFLGNRVAIYVDNPSEPIWEGFINRLTFSVGGTAFTISLDEMMNKVNVRYAPSGAAITEVTATATLSSAASQALYGIKEGTLDIGFQRVTGTTKPQTMADTKLTQLAWPKQSKTAQTSAPPGVVHLEMLGFYHTLKWQERVLVTVATGTLTNMITGGSGILPNLANGATFFDNTDFSQVATNAVTMPLNEFMGKTMWDTAVEVQETGDTNKNYYVIGITPTNFNTGKRQFFYRAFNSTIDYVARMGDGLRVRDTARKLVPAWRVRPDHGILITDWIIGGAISGDDPRETYIWQVDYDANSQRVTWGGDDQLSSEAAFQLHRNTKSFGKRFGAIPYRSATT